MVPVVLEADAHIVRLGNMSMWGMKNVANFAALQAMELAARTVHPRNIGTVMALTNVSGVVPPVMAAGAHIVLPKSTKNKEFYRGDSL